MKKAILLFIMILTGSLVLYSQVPQAMTYKAIAKDDWGVALPGKAITLRFTILQGSESGMPVYIEVHSTVTNKFGLMDVQIGKGIPSLGSFSGINWSTGIYYIKIEMDPKGGSDFRLEDPAHQLLSVPYALYAGGAANGFSGYYSDLIGTPYLSLVATSGNYNDLMGKPILFSGDYNDLTNKPSLFSGNYNDLTNKPNLFDGTWGSLTGKPSFSAVAFSGSWNDLIEKPSLFDGTWVSLSGKPAFAAVATSGSFADLSNIPTTIAGFGITDAMSTSHPTNGIIGTDITNWNAAFSWGNHAGLYKPLSYVPVWAEVIGNPFNITSPAADQILKYSAVSSKWENWTSNFLTTEVDGSVTNEIQDLILTDDKLKITNNVAATEIDLTPYKADGSETRVISGNNVIVTGSGTTSSPYSINSTGGGTAIPGNHPGDMQYWNGTSWVLLPVGSNGQVLTLTNGVPTWGSGSLPIQLPVLITTPVINIGPNAANSGGNITIDGGSPVAARGVCWNTSGNPTLANSNTIDGYGIGVFTSSITGLTLGNTYYVRAYATNSAGTAYGNEISFTANPGVATLLTTAITSIAATTAYSGGNVSNDGGASVTERGVCWNTTAGPTTYNSKTIDGSGTGSFSSSLTKLAANTTYYVRTYATNSAGTAYGNELSFTTPTISIGDNYQGGKVAYILQPGDPGYIAGETHGLIAAPSDQGTTEASWNNRIYIETRPTSRALGTGNENTNNIVASLGEGYYAASFCYYLVSGGYSDWYLPSQDELYKLYLNRAAIGGFDLSYHSVYWSSSEDPSFLTNARTQSFFDGTQSNDMKENSLKVRAVRSF